MHTLQSIIQQKVLQQINKQKTEPLESIYITYSSATKIKLSLEDAAQVRKVMQGIQSVHLQKQQSEALISSNKGPVLNVDNNNAMNQVKNEDNKQSPQKGRFLVRNEYGSKLQSENKINHSSVAPNKYHKNQLSFGECGKKIKAEDIWKRRKDYDQKVRQFHLPKIKEYNRFQNNSLQKQQSGQHTAEIQFSDIFKEDIDDDLLQEYNEKYYKKQLFLWNKKQRQFDIVNDDLFD
ncbi:unnamed protein product [Paramecium pentaurelia]|uniref:Uncharacterized protein n=1 Tax=Paramecium pentaurelia TaxID=43138 RepID=A0A8S1S9D9_9CILI|nr:unnamed protein product [Paramecium pentaurelia]